MWWRELLWVGTPGAGISEASFIWSLLVATILGALLGLERSMVGKHAGMRTYALVSLGSCLFAGVGVMASTTLGPFGAVDPLRIASSIVIGIGFIGTGLALMGQGRHVQLTTAAGIWVAAGIGMASAFGLYLTATATTIIAIAVFWLFLSAENKVRDRLVENGQNGD